MLKFLVSSLFFQRNTVATYIRSTIISPALSIISSLRGRRGAVAYEDAHHRLYSLVSN